MGNGGPSTLEIASQSQIKGNKVFATSIKVCLHTGCPGPIFEISIANNYFLVEVRPIVPLSKKCPYGGTFCLNHS